MKTKKPMKVVNKKFTSNWRVCGVLAKPVAEHVGKPVIVVVPKLKPEGVQILDKDKNKIKTLRLRSINPDYAFQDYYETADKYPKPVYVRVFLKKVIWDFLWKNPKKRSDGNGILLMRRRGNYQT